MGPYGLILASPPLGPESSGDDDHGLRAVMMMMMKTEEWEEYRYVDALVEEHVRTGT